MRHPSEPGWTPEDPPALDGDSAERLASGRTAPDDAPPGYEGVASLLHSVASAAGPEPKGEAATVAAMAAVLAPATPTSLSSRRRHSMITKLVPAKVAAVAVGALLSTGAAAAAGALPDPVQSAVSSALGTVGLQVPDGNDGSGSDAADVDETTTTTLGDTTTTTLDDITTTTLDTTTTTTPTGGGDDGTGTDACTSAANHGEFVSGVAHATPPGPGHGAVVSDAAQSDCGHQGGDDDDAGEVDDGDDDGENRGPGGGADTGGSNRGSGNGNGNNGNGNGGPGNGNGSHGNSGPGGRGGRG